MKGVFYLILLFLVGMFISCSTTKNVQNGAVKSDDHTLKTVSYGNHSGRYEHCSICQRVRMNQESAIAQLNTELPEVKVEGYEKVLILNKESFRLKDDILAEKKVVPKKIHRVHRVEPLESKEEITSINKGLSTHTDNETVNGNQDKPKTEIFGILGLIFGLGGVFLVIAPLYLLPIFSLASIFIALGLAVIAFIFGMISWTRIENNPQLYKGKWIAFASLYLGYIGWSLFLANLTIYFLVLFSAV